MSLDREILRGYFNEQDHSPLYKRQLSHQFEKYILTCVRSARRNSLITYKISYTNEPDKEYAEPLTYAIRRHFAESKASMIAAFERFKRRTYLLLVVSVSVVIVCHGLLPLLLKGQESSIHSGLTNSLDVFSWVILWKPIDRLIFYWNPFLKDISILDRLEKADVVMTNLED